MSATGLDVFDKTLQLTNTWLDEIVAELGPDRQVAWHVLGAVLRAVRDNLPMDLSAPLGAQLPLLVRGTYYDRWQPEKQPDRTRSLDEFLQKVEVDLSDTRPVNSRDATRTVFQILSGHLDRGQSEKVRHALPEEVRRLWPEGALDDAPERAASGNA